MSIEIPRIESLEIQGLNLFPRGISWSVSSGVNAIVGGNGLGKTTVVRSLLFGLIGQNSRVKLDYFRDRLGRSYDGEPFIGLTIEAASDYYEVQRSLQSGNIIEALRNGEILDLPENEEGDSFEKLLASSLGFSRVDDLAVVLTRLVFPEESGRSLVWDIEQQNHVLVLFFLGERTQEDLEDLRNRVTLIDSQKRQTSWQRKPIKDALGQLHRLRKKHLQDLGRVAESTDLHLELEKTESELSKAEERLDALSSTILEEEERLAGMSSELHDAIEESEDLEVQVLSLERTLYEWIYPSESFHLDLAVSKLRKHGQCIFCNAKSQTLKDTANGRFEEGYCQFCGSELPKKDRLRQKVKETSRLNEFTVKLEEIRRERDSIQKGVKRLGDELNDKRDEYSRLSLSADGLRIEKHRLSDALKFQQQRERAEVTTPYDPEIKAMEKRISEFEDKIAELSEEHEKAKSRLDSLTDTVGQKLEQVRQDLARKFQTFASSFLQLKCELKFEERRRQLLEFGVFFPHFLKKTRRSPNSVSESQRIFLDHAFRMAILELHRDAGASPSLYVVETPESPLDLSYSQNVAEMLADFADGGHTLLVTSNLSFQGFLARLFDTTPPSDRADRILNLLKVGRPTSVQLQFADDFDAALATVLEGVNHSD